MNKVLLIDGHSILNRAFYGLPLLTNAKGQHTNAVLGFLNILLKLLDEEQATHVFVAFDVHQPTFRHVKYEEYKGTRKGMPEELREQVPILKEVLHAMGITTVEKGGYEADDIIGTLSRVADGEGYQVVIVSGDRDLLQLATDRILVRIPKTKPSGTIVENYYAKDVVEKYQVTPTEFIDLKGLMGDSSDNIKGVPGIGEKTATKIITEFHSIENAYAHIEEVMPNKARENLKTHYDQAVFSKWLATIKLDCELDVNLEDGLIENLFTEDAYVLFKSLEFKQLLKHFEEPQAVTQELEYRIVDDWNDAISIKDTLLQADSLGVFVLGNANGFQAVSMTVNCEDIYIFIEKGFMTGAFLKDMVLEVLLSRSNRQMTQSYPISTLDIKKLLHQVEAAIEQSFAVFDAGLAAYLLNPLKDTYSYDDLARDYLGMVVPDAKELLGKTEINSFTIYEAEILKYLAYSSYIPALSQKKLFAELERQNMLELYQNIELPCAYTLYHMERAGVRIDQQALKEYGVMLSKEIDILEKRIYEQCGEEFNINSPKQLGVILFEKLELPNGKKTKTGYSTSADVLDKLKNEYPVVQDILDYRTYSKLKSTYADGLLHYVAEDGRIYGTFNQTITATGRISSTEPNLQNIPMRLELGRQIRKVFIPNEDCVFVDADYSQIELRVLAHMSQDPTLLDAYNKGLDIHAATAAEIFDVSMDAVTDAMRRAAKVVNFGIIYGQSAFGLSQELNITRKEASAYIDKYFETYPNVKGFQESSIEKAKATGTVVTLWNRIRPVPEIASSNFMQRSFGERIAMNSPIQGTAADIIKLAMIRVEQRMIEENLKSRLILQIHDELLIEAAMDEVEQVQTILQEEMIQVAKLLIPLEIDMHQGDNWYETK